MTGDFGAALCWLKQGQRVQRQAWTAKGISLRLRNPDDQITSPFILLTRSDGIIAPWQACHNDLLADDWRQA